MKERSEIVSIAKKHRILSFILISLILIQCILFTVPTSAVSFEGDNNETDTVTGGVVSAKLFTTGKVIGKAESWEGLKGTSSVFISSALENFSKISSDSNSLSAKISFKNKPVLQNAKEIGIYIDPITESPYTVTFTADHNNGTSSVSKKIDVTSKMYVFLQLPAGTYSILNVSVSVTFDKTKSDEPFEVILYDTVSSEADHTENISRFSAFNLEGMEKSNIVSGNSPVIGSSVITDSSDENFVFSTYVESSSGSITFYLASDGENFVQYGSSILSPNRHSYVFEVPGTLSDTSAYKIEYSGNESMKLTGVSVIPFIGVKSDQSLGSISKCSYSEENETLTVNGTITRDAAAAYPQGEIRLYEIPMWQNSTSVFSASPVLTVGMTTTFSMQHTVSPEHSMFCSYVVAIHYDGKLYPLTDPIFPGRGLAPTPTVGKLTVLGLSCEDSFTAGFDRCVIDIDASDLFLNKNASHDTVFSYDGTIYYPSKAAVNNISKKVDFLSAAGIDVIFRVTDSVSDGFYPELETGCRDFAALISFLNGTFSPDGIIIDSVQVKNKSLSAGQLISVKAKNTSSLIRLASSVAGKDTVIYSATETNNSELFTWFLTKYIDDMPMINWELLIPADADSSIDTVEATATSNGYSSGISVLLTADSQTAANVLAAAETSARRSVFIKISDGKLPVDTSTENNVFPVSDTWNDKNGEFLIWDFTSSYNHQGFTVLSGKTGLYTRMSPVLSEYTGVTGYRSLNTVLDEESRLILAEPPYSMRLTDCPKVRFLLECTSDTPFSLDFIFISGKNRVTFTADFVGTGIYTPVCDLSGTDIAGKVDRIAIVLKNGTKAEVGIATVSATGDKNIAEITDSIYIKETTSVTEQVAPSDTSSENTPGINMEYFVIGSVILISVLVFALLSIRKPDETPKE